MKLKDRIRVTLRGYQTLNDLIPGYLPFAGIKAILEAFLPFVNIYMSGRIVTAIADKSTLGELGLLVLWTVVANFTTTMLIKFLSRMANVKSSMFWSLAGLPLDRKIQTTDYEYVEDSKVHAMRAVIDLEKQQQSRGLPRLYWMYYERGIQCFFQLVFSVVFVIGVFTTQPVYGAGRWDILFSPVVTVLLIVVFLGSLIWSVHNNKELAQKEYAVVSGISDAARVGNHYYSLFFEYKAGKDLKLYRLRESSLGGMRQASGNVITAMRRIQKIGAWYNSLAAVNATLISGLIYVYVAVKALFGAFAVGNIVQYVGSLTQFTAGFNELVTIVSDMLINAESLKRFFDFIDMPDKKYKGGLPVEKRAFCEGGDNDYEIEFRDVSFRYPGSEQYALQHVSFKFHIGERLAIVGMNGSGKTTFIKLLCRLYDPTEGEILLNGVNIKKYDYEEYMSIFAVVFQDYSLFSFGLGQNVAASVEYDRKRVEICLQKAGFGERLKNMPKGTDTCLYKDFEEDGVEISGGEAQKIALARALYKNAPFIVLDEPTAALDPISEAEVYSNFDQIVEDKTAIYISHRLSSCRFCDEIVVFDQGHIVQQGSHKELVADSAGKYHELWYAQAQYYEQGEPA